MAPEHMRPAMNELRWTELAALVVAWHNRHPLARRIGVQDVLIKPVTASLLFDTVVRLLGHARLHPAGRGCDRSAAGG